MARHIVVDVEPFVGCGYTQPMEATLFDPYELRALWRGELPYGLQESNLHSNKQHQFSKAGWGKGDEGNRLHTGWGWYGVKGMAEIDAIMSTGWDEGAKKAEGLRMDALKDMTLVAKNRKRQQKWDEEGDEVAYDKMLAGDIDTMWRRTVRHVVYGQPTHLTLAFNFGGNSNRTAEELFWTAAAGAVLTEILENAGYSVDAYAISNIDQHTQHQNNKGKHHGYTRWNRVVAVHIKKSGEMLDMEAMLTIAGHAASFRTVGFSALCLTKGATPGFGLGHCSDIASCVPHLVKHDLIPAPDVVLSHAYDPKTAVEVIRRELRELSLLAETY